MELFNNISIKILVVIIIGLPLKAARFTEDSRIESEDRRFAGQDVIIDGCTLTIDGEHTFNSLQIVHGGAITHSQRFTPALHLIIENDAFIDAGSMIDASGKGYGPEAGPGKGNTGVHHGAGAGHGGSGGQSDNNNNNGALGGSVYEAPEQPSIFGSGGGNGYQSVGGAGGGAVHLTVKGRLTVDGIISADGLDGTGSIYLSRGGGGGSGGSVHMVIGILTGGGMISANGGWGHFPTGSQSKCGGGGGGRIAINCANNMFWGVASARGGKGYINGGAGTVFIKCDTDTVGQLFIDNFGHSGARTPLPRGQYIYDTVTVSDSASFLVGSGIKLVASDIQVVDGGTMTVKDSGDIDIECLTVSSDGIFFLDKPETIPYVQIEPGGIASHSTGQGNFDLIVSNDMIIRMGGMLSVNGQGYIPATGPGRGDSGTHYGGGAGYGGAGGQSYNDTGNGAAGGTVYGDPNYPRSYGSGGGTGYQSIGGAGGGAVQLTVKGRLIVDGIISADGLDGTGSIYLSQGGGGGSGGSVHMVVGILTGGGMISANGGWGHFPTGNQSTCGGGGGGRIAIYTFRDNFFGIVSANGGKGYENGQEGTISYGNYDPSLDQIIN